MQKNASFIYHVEMETGLDRLMRVDFAWQSRHIVTTMSRQVSGHSV
jgi:hypothetical protein